MKAVDGMQIAQRPEAAIRSAARFALELAGKSKHCEAVADCAHCNLTFLATWAESMLTDLSRAGMPSEKGAAPEIPGGTAGCQGCADLSQLLAEASLKLIRDRQATRILTTTPMGITQTTGVFLDSEHYNKLIDDINQANAALFETRKLRDDLFKQLDEQKQQIAALTLERNTLKAELARLNTRCPVCGGRDVISNGPYDYTCHHCADLGIIESLEAKVERLSAPVSDEEWTNVVVVSPQHDHRTWMERKQVDSIIAARASAPPTTNPITDDGPDECEGCDKPLRDDEGHETDDMVMLCDECWQGCADDPDCHSEECPCEACAAKIGTMKHPINDDEQRRKDAGWNDRPKARCACGEMIAWYSGEYLHVAGRSKSCADGRPASPAHFLVGMPPAEPEWKKEKP